MTRQELCVRTKNYKGGITYMGGVAMNSTDTRRLSPIRATAKTILVVDDADFIRRLVSMVLTIEGYAVIEATDGKEALAKMGENHVDMIITDLNMPGMNGIELVSIMRSKEAYRHIPVVMLTSEFYELNKEKAFEAGINEWVPKPFITSRLRDLVFKYA